MTVPVWLWLGVCPYTLVNGAYWWQYNLSHVFISQWSRMMQNCDSLLWLALETVTPQTQYSDIYVLLNSEYSIKVIPYLQKIIQRENNYRNLLMTVKMLVVLDHMCFSLLSSSISYGYFKVTKQQTRTTH